jgi:hypothetical protein
MPPKSFLPNRSVGGEIRAYGREVRAWSTGLLRRYVFAVALLMAAFASMIAGIAVGLDALFHFLEMRYGAWTAYAVIGGLLIVLAIVTAALGVLKLKQAPPSLPNPRQHASAASRIAAAESIGALASSGRAVAARPVVPVALGLASVGLLGWLATSRRASAKTHVSERNESSH